MFSRHFFQFAASRRKNLHCRALLGWTAIHSVASVKDIGGLMWCGSGGGLGNGLGFRTRQRTFGFWTDHAICCQPFDFLKSLQGGLRLTSKFSIGLPRIKRGLLQQALEPRYRRPLGTGFRSAGKDVAFETGIGPPLKNPSDSSRKRQSRDNIFEL
jgi:hypothetical protein